jgi:hypothetical protein
MDEGTWNSQSWTALPIPAIIDRTTGNIMSGTVRQGGFELSSISRWCLPDEDRAEFFMDYGVINGETVQPVDLSNKVIRIQVLNDESFPNGVTSIPDNWKTVFVGSVIHTKGMEFIGNRRAGRITYYCAGALWRTRMWPLDRHTSDNSVHAKGHPGYNVPLHGYFRKVLGNKGTGVSADPFGDLTGTPDISSYYLKHSIPIDGSGSPDLKFTDEEVIKHALVSSRAKNEMKVLVDLSTGLFGGTFSWPVSPGDTCWDILRRICNRQRGRGSVYCEYEDSGSGGSEVTLTLKASPSHTNDIVYKQFVPGEMDGTTLVTIPAATIGEDAVNVDINGDHRIISNSFLYENRLSSVYDVVVVQGEKIQVLCNLNFFGGSLSKRWSTDDQTAFDAITNTYVRQRTSGRWRHVYRRYGTVEQYDLTVKNEPGADSVSINYYTDATGEIKIGNPAEEYGLSSNMTFRILPDLPIYEGWNYTTIPAERFDEGSDYLPPDRTNPIIMYQADTNTGDGKMTWFPLHQAGFNIQPDDFGLLIINQNEESNGFRYLAGSTAPSYRSFASDYSKPDITLASGVDLNKLNTILGVEIGTRVSIQYDNGADPNKASNYDILGKRLTLTISGIHLWLGAPGAIWELDYIQAETVNKWRAGLKLPDDKIAAILRDDRNDLSFIAALTWEYFGHVHNPGTWGLKDCGLLDAFTDINGYRRFYPTLGQIVSSVTTSGNLGSIENKITLDTPISSIHYNHAQCETTWRTDFISYDGNNQ